MWDAVIWNIISCMLRTMARIKFLFYFFLFVVFSPKWKGQPQNARLSRECHSCRTHGGSFWACAGQDSFWLGSRGWICHSRLTGALQADFGGSCVLLCRVRTWVPQVTVPGEWAGNKKAMEKKKPRKQGRSYLVLFEERLKNQAWCLAEVVWWKLFLYEVIWISRLKCVYLTLPKMVRILFEEMWQMRCLDEHASC